MSIEVEAAHMLVDPGKGAELLDDALCRLQHFALQALRLPWDVLYFGRL